MFKRVGTSLLLALAMLASTLNFGSGFARTVVTATPACFTISECVNVASEARHNIAEIIDEENELNDEIATLNEEIVTLRGTIENLELSINEIILEIAALQTEIKGIQAEIADNFKLLEQTEAEIEILKDAVAERMTITQRMENRNTAFIILSESDDLTDFISQLRFFNRVANTDANVMDQLTELLALYDGLIETLSNQATMRETAREELGVAQKRLEDEQAIHESNQEGLLLLEGQLREELYYLGVQRMTEEEVLAVAEEAREILERTPPPPVRTTNTASTAAPGVLVHNSGLTHPMPGAIVTSHFGPRSLDGFHWGIDWALPGTPSILAAASGTVVRNAWMSGGYGWYVIIAHEINGQRVDTVYAHMLYQSPIVAGETVSQGQVIGTQGSTGFSTGPHLHFEIHPGGFAWNNSVDPRLWLNP